MSLEYKQLLRERKLPEEILFKKIESMNIPAENIIQTS